MRRVVLHRITLCAYIVAAALLIVLLFAYSQSYAAVMNSTNYSIETDSINIGGNRATSSNYTIEDTVGEIATGISSSTSYIVKAGYQQMQSVYIAMSAPADVTMSPAIGGVSGGTANGSTSFTVTTDGAAGYTVTITASSSPALVSDSDSFADYVPTGDPDFTFTVVPTASTFAFTPEGDDITSTYKDNGSSCNTGAGDTASACWDGLSTSAKTIVTRTSSNQPSGTLTTIRFRAASGASHIQTAGTYTATTTITALAL